MEVARTSTTSFYDLGTSRRDDEIRAWKKRTHEQKPDEENAMVDISRWDGVFPPDEDILAEKRRLKEWKKFEKEQ